jgi:hypothetical protein
MKEDRRLQMKEQVDAPLHASVISRTKLHEGTLGRRQTGQSCAWDEKDHRKAS